jgi:ABC-type microcin C transport system permease subunit YejB
MTIIEIVFCVYLAKNLREKLKHQGRSGWGYVFLGIVLVVIGNFIFALIGVFLNVSTIYSYLLGFCGMGVGSYVAHTIVDRLAPD